MSVELNEKVLTTADLAAVTEMPTAQGETSRAFQATPLANQRLDEKKEAGALAPLFSPTVTSDFRLRWDSVQSSFVDDPAQAVRQGDELVAQVLKSLAESFSSERAKLESPVDSSVKASTEDLRVALRRYRSFFERLLAL